MTQQFLSALAIASLLLNVNPTALSSEPSSFVVSYEPGVGAASRFTDPAAAAGAPSQINPFGESTDPFNPPYGTNQIVSIGAGGHLILAFTTPLLNHPNNLFGLDFTVFGNTGFIITNEFDPTISDWIGTPATDGSLFGFSTGEILVSVSRNGRDFFLLDPAKAPQIDAFPPTDGTGDPGIPVIPGISAADFAGATLEDIRRLYAGSAGGASFDLSWALDGDGQSVRLPQVRYIRIDVLSGRAEIDAVAAVQRMPQR
jgi:hypothetical protein